MVINSHGHMTKKNVESTCENKNVVVEFPYLVWFMIYFQNKLLLIRQFTFPWLLEKSKR
jgi:hypothetical protein